MPSAFALPDLGPALLPPFLVGEVRVEPSLNRLHRDGGVEHVEPRVMLVLVRLARTPGAVVSREALSEVAWGDTLVSDEGLTQAVSRLRKALGDQGTQRSFVETVPKVGYRLIAPVGPAPEAEAPSFSGDGLPDSSALAASEVLLLPAVLRAPSARPRSKGRVPRWAAVALLALVVGAGAWVAGREAAAPAATRIEYRRVIAGPAGTHEHAADMVVPRLERARAAGAAHGFTVHARIRRLPLDAGS